MALKTTGLKKRKKKGPPSVAKKPPKHWTGKPVGPGRPKKPPVGVKKPEPYKPGPGKPEKPRPKKPGPGKPKKRPPIPPKRPVLTPGKPPKGKPNFGNYVSKHKDLAEAYKKHKAKGGKGTKESWGKMHYEKHGKKEKRKLS